MALPFIKKAINVLALIAFFNIKTFCQISDKALKFNSLISNGEWENFSKNYQRSNERFLLSSQIASLDDYCFLMLSKNYIHLKDQKKALFYLGKAFAEGMPLSDLEDEVDSLCISFFNSHKKEIGTLYTVQRKIFYNKIDVDVLTKIETLLTVDQYVRSPITRLKGEDNPIYEIFRVKVRRYADSINEIKLKKLIKQYDINIFKLIGNYNSFKIKLLAWHHISLDAEKKDTIAVNFYINFFMKAINECKIPSHFYSSTIDRAYPSLTQNKDCFSIYGTGSEMDDNGKQVYIKICDIEEIDKRRKNIGQLSLYQNALMLGILLPDNYSIPKEFNKK